VITSVDEWLIFLKQSHTAVGFPLVVAGIALMFFGWRMWKLCVMLSYAVIGAVIGALLIGPCDEQWMYALCGAAVLGLISYWPVNIAVSVLGGLIGAGIITFSLAEIGLKGTTLWTAGGIAMAGCTAFAFLNRQHIVIVVTAFLGAVLLMSGVATWVMQLPALYGTLRQMATGSAIVLPFILIVPTVMSSFYQAAEVRRLNVNL